MSKNYELSEGALIEKAFKNEEAIKASTREEDRILYDAKKPLILNDEEKIVEIYEKMEEDYCEVDDYSKFDYDSEEDYDFDEDAYFEGATEEELANHKKYQEFERKSNAELEKIAERQAREEAAKEKFDDKLRYEAYRQSQYNDETECYKEERSAFRDVVIVFLGKDGVIAGKDDHRYEVTIYVDLSLDEIEEKLKECNSEYDISEAFELY